MNIQIRMYQEITFAEHNDTFLQHHVQSIHTYAAIYAYIYIHVYYMNVHKHIHVT